MKRYCFGSFDVAQRNLGNVSQRTDVNFPDNSSTHVQQDGSDGSDVWSGSEFADAVEEAVSGIAAR